MMERSNEGMMQGWTVKKVTFFVSMLKGLYVVSDCIGKMTAYMLKMDICKHYMTTEMYSVKNGMYICSDGMKYPTVYRIYLNAITNLLNVLIHTSIEILYGANIWIHGMSICTQTMNVCKSYIDNYN